MHFCLDEALAIAGAVPFIGYAIMRVRALLHRGCRHDHRSSK